MWITNMGNHVAAEVSQNTGVLVVLVDIEFLYWSGQSWFCLHKLQQSSEQVEMEDTASFQLRSLLRPTPKVGE